MKNILIIIFIFILPTCLFSQEYRGKTLNSKNQPISFSTITIKNDQDSSLHMVSTDVEGNFHFNIIYKIQPGDYVLIEHVSYHTKKILLTDLTKQSIIILDQKNDLLDQVVVKSRPIVTQKGDTTKYDVSSFAKDEDRSIGDVMNRMPGMQYTDDGKIYYNGKRVNNLLVDGDKILGNNTKLGGNSIQKDQVKDLEVIKDYHDKKMNKGKVESDELAVNLKLKDNVPIKVSGLNQIGIGSNKTYDIKSDITSFNKKFKLISSSSANNIGKDVSIDNEQGNFLNGASINRPSIDLNRYYNNQSWHHSSAYSKKIAKSLEFNSNFSFFADKEIFGNKNEQKYLLENDQFVYTEDQMSRTKPLMALFNTTFESNENAHFFKNKSELFYQENNIQTNSLLNGSLIRQNYENRFLKFNNQLMFDKNLKNGFTLSTSWTINSSKGAETLLVNPNISLENLKNKDIYQTVQMPDLNNKLSADLSKKIRNTNYSLQGDIYQINQSLHSILSVHENIFVPLFLNEFRWRENRTTITPNIYYNKNNIRISASAPIVQGNWKLNDSIAKYNNNQNKWFVQPRVMFRYSFHSEHYLQFVGSFNRIFEGIESMYRNPILTSYKTLEQKLNTLNYKNSLSGILEWKLTNVRKFLFLNMAASYYSQLSNFIVSSKLTENGIQNYTVAMDNKIDYWEISAGASKLFHESKTNIGVNVKNSWSYYNQLLNDQQYAYLQNTTKFDAKLTQDIGANTILTTTWIRETIGNKVRNEAIKIPATKFTVNKLSTKLSHTAFKKMNLNIFWNFHQVNQSNSINWNYNFLDVSIKYKLNKKYQLELMIYNFTNVKRFETFSLNSIVENHSIYNLRGRMGLLKLNFNF